MSSKLSSVRYASFWREGRVPKVSVIMNCYNGERYLREAIDSVFAQTFADWEIIFWDNVSTDGSAEIAHSYKDERFRYFRAERNVPLGAARKLAMEQACGEWIGFLDTDDFWLPQKLERQLQVLDGSDHVLCYAGIREIHPDGSDIRVVLPAYTSGQMLDAQLRDFDINMVTPLLRRAAMIEHGLSFDPNVTASEEYNLFMRLMAKGTVCALKEVLGCWRIAPGTLTDRSIAKWADERFYTLEQLEAENPGISARNPIAIAAARARGRYYRARYLMSIGESKAARAELASVKSIDLSYRLLGLAACVSPLWRILHSNVVKRKWLPRLRRIVSSA